MSDAKKIHSFEQSAAAIVECAAQYFAYWSELVRLGMAAQEATKAAAEFQRTMFMVNLAQRPENGDASR